MCDSELDARLEKLERQNRWLKRAGLIALVLVGSALLTGFAAQRPAKPAAVTETLEAQRFVLKNARGEIRAELSLLKDEPELALFDAKGNTRAQLGLQAGESGLALFDPKWKAAAWLVVGTDGPSLTLSDAAGFMAVIGTTELETIRTGEARRTSAASVVLLDNKAGKIIWRTP